MTPESCTCTSLDDLCPVCLDAGTKRSRQSHTNVAKGQHKLRERDDDLADALATESEERRYARCMAEERGIDVEAAYRFICRQRDSRRQQQAYTEQSGLYCCGRWHALTVVPLTVPCCGKTYFTQELPHA